MLFEGDCSERHPIARVHAPASYVRDGNYVKVGLVTSFNEGDMLNSAVSKIWRVHSELRKRRQLCKSRLVTSFWGRLLKGAPPPPNWRVHSELRKRQCQNYVKVGWSHLFEGDCSKGLLDWRVHSEFDVRDGNYPPQVGWSHLFEGRHCSPPPPGGSNLASSFRVT